MQDRPLTVQTLLSRVERNFGHKRVITGGAEDTIVTWANVASRARRLVHVLEALNVPAGACVGTFAWNSQRHVELYLGVPSSGRVLHTINHRLFSDQITFIVNDAADDVLFIDRSILPVVWPLVASFETVRHVIVMDDGGDMPLPDQLRGLDYEHLLSEQRDRPIQTVVDDENAAASLCYTSGTTGNPKGVLYSHRSIVLHSLLLLGADVFALSESDVVAPIVPMFHVNAWGLPYAVMQCGSDLVLPGTATSPDELASLLARHQVTFSAAVATVWRDMIPSLEGRDLSHLRHIACGGGAVDDALSRAYEAAIGIPLTNAWGMTETSPVVTTSRLARPHRELTGEARRLLLGTPGPAIPMTEIRIMSDDGMEQPRDGTTPGELQVAGATIASSYFGSDAGKDSFTPDGWLRTGDVGTIDQWGYLRIVDRTKDLVKSGGEWISSVELENAVMSDPRVKEAAVIGISDPRWGERPMACVVPSSGVSLTAEDVREHLHGRVASWWIPERIEMMNEIPKTATGKWSKQELRQQFVATTPEPTLTSKGAAMPLQPRLIVTGHNADGDAVFVEDRHPEPVTVQALPGADFYLLWGTPDSGPKVGEKEAAPVLRPYFPGLGGSRILFLRWAAYSADPEPVPDRRSVADEVAEKLPGLLDPFEEGGDGMHTTDTVDYAICLEGELCLQLDNGAEVTLTPGTCVVQLGTRHAWKNRSDKPALMCYVQLGAVRVG